jgi:hypothetical protein
MGVDTSMLDSRLGLGRQWESSKDGRLGLGRQWESILIVLNRMPRTSGRSVSLKDMNLTRSGSVANKPRFGYLEGPAVT